VWKLAANASLNVAILLVEPALWLLGYGSVEPALEPSEDLMFPPMEETGPVVSKMSASIVVRVG
jgi:hypothetical protein